MLLLAPVIALSGVLAPAAASGQDIGEGLLTGLAGAVLVAPGVVSIRAIVFDRPTYGIGEGVTSVGLPAAWATLAAGGFGGGFGGDRLGELRRGAALGLAGGAAAGLLVGVALDRERWLGWTTIGIALGAVGGAVLGLLEDPEDAGGASLTVELLRLRR